MKSTVSDGRRGKDPSARRLAAIDVGTNSIRCLVVEVGDTGGFRILHDENNTVRLGLGLFESGRISPEAWKRAGDALARIREITDSLGVTRIEAVATSAVRKAVNGAAFVKAMEEGTGIRIVAVGPDVEASLAVMSASTLFHAPDVRQVVVDIGGGSVEVVIGTGGNIEDIFSLEIGAVYLTEKFFGSDPFPPDQLRKLRRFVRKSFHEVLGEKDLSLRHMIGSGGTFTSLGRMVMAARKEKCGSLGACELHHSDVVRVLDMLKEKSGEERKAVEGLSPERADIIVAGVAVVDELMRWFAIGALKINERGIREGLIVKMMGAGQKIREDAAGQGPKMQMGRS